MSLDESTSQLIGRIYEAAFDTDAWGAVIKDVMSRTQSRVAFVTSVDLHHGAFNRTFFYAPEDSRVDRGVREYAEGMYTQDPALNWAVANPCAGECATESILSRDEFADHPYIQWQRDRLGTAHFRVMYTAPIDGMAFSLALHPAAGDGPASGKARALHRLLFGHLERAVRLAARPPDFSRDTGAIIALDRYGRVVASSPGADALFAKSDGLAIEGRRLVATNPETTALLECRINAAIDAQASGGVGGGVRITRNSGRPRWLALISPYPRFLEHLPIPTPAVIVRILESEAHLTLSAMHADLLRLTHREVEIACAFLEGHSIDSLAARLGMSRNTARVHLQSLFRKTGTNRQSDLVRVLTAIASQ